MRPINSHQITPAAAAAEKNDQGRFRKLPSVVQTGVILASARVIAGRGRPPVDEPETDRGSPGSGDSQNWSSPGPLKKLAFQKTPRAPLWMIVQSGTLKYLMTRHPVESLWSRNVSLLSRIE